MTASIDRVPNQGIVLWNGISRELHMPGEIAPMGDFTAGKVEFGKGTWPLGLYTPVNIRFAGLTIATQIAKSNIRLHPSLGYGILVQNGRARGNARIAGRGNDPVQSRDREASVIQDAKNAVRRLV